MTSRIFRFEQLSSSVGWGVMIVQSSSRKLAHAGLKRLRTFLIKNGVSVVLFTQKILVQWVRFTFEIDKYERHL